VKSYLGTRGQHGKVLVLVKTGDDVRPLEPRLDLYNHSPMGFEYGYGGSGPAQLALAILADHLETPANALEIFEIANAFGDDGWERHSLAERMALRLHQDFKFAVIGGLPRSESFELTEAQVSQTIAELCEGRRR
jgi:hypothetical protein